MHVYTQLCFISVQYYLRELEHCSPVRHFKLAADLQSAVSTSASPLPFPVGSSTKCCEAKPDIKSAWKHVTRCKNQRLCFWAFGRVVNWACYKTSSHEKRSCAQLGLKQNNDEWQSELHSPTPFSRFFLFARQLVHVTGPVSSSSVDGRWKNCTWFSNWGGALCALWNVRLPGANLEKLNSNTLFTALRVRISSRALEARRRRTQLNAPRCGENTILALQTRRFSTLLNAPRCGENIILVLQARRLSTLLNAPRCGAASILANPHGTWTVELMRGKAQVSANDPEPTLRDWPAAGAIFKISLAEPGKTFRQLPMIDVASKPPAASFSIKSKGHGSAWSTW